MDSKKITKSEMKAEAEQAKNVLNAEAEQAQNTMKTIKKSRFKTTEDSRLRRKIDTFLEDWKKRPDHKPLIVKGARQVGKTEAIRHFAKANYGNFIEINFIEQPKFKAIFDEGFEPNDILKHMTLLSPELKFVPGDTLIFFDELQDFPNAATSLKFFNQDGRFDVICSGSLMGINYREINSNSVGNKEDYELYSLDFEEFLWARGFTDLQIAEFYEHLKTLTPFSELELGVLFGHFQDYLVVGGMPEIVANFVKNKTFENTLGMQRQILADYEDDITKYATSLDKGRILNVFHKIPVFLGNENRKFQVSKIDAHSRTREYYGAIEWLESAGIINTVYCMGTPSLPLKGNYNPDNYRIYFRDTGLLIGSLDDEAQQDFRLNQNLSTYKGAVYENLVADALKKSGFPLYFYKNEKSTIEMDFMVRDENSLVPLEVKSIDGASASLRRLVSSEAFSDIRYGIKLCRKNLGFNGEFYTIPYFMTFMLKRYLSDVERVRPENWKNV